MKNIKKLIFVLVLVCVMALPSAVKAEGTELKLDCSKTILLKDGEKLKVSTYAENEEGVSCTLELESTDAFKSISFKLDKGAVGEKAIVESLDNNIIVAGDLESGYTITKNNNGTLSAGDLLVIEDITMPSIDKATFDKKTSQYNYDIKVISAKFVNTADKTITGYDAKATIRLLSTDKTLSSLSIDGVGLDSKQSKHKYATSNAKIKYTATAGNQKAYVNGKLKEVKDVEIKLSYGPKTLQITVISEYANYLNSINAKDFNLEDHINTYIIEMFRYYRLFPGYNFEFNSKHNTYTLNVGKDITKFAICKNGADDIFVKKAGVVCINTEVLKDVYGYEKDDQQATYYRTLKLNGTYVTADWESLSAKEKFDRWEPVPDADGNQTEYIILADLKDGENVLTFSVDDLHPEYKVVINKGEKSDALTDEQIKEENIATGKGDSGTVNNTPTTDKNDKVEENVKDETVDSPKTGIVTYTLVILGVAAIAGGAYYYLRKKNIIKKI